MHLTRYRVHTTTGRQFDYWGPSDTDEPVKSAFKADKALMAQTLSGRVSSAEVGQIASIIPFISLVKEI
jgi:hypothetical protein